MAALLGQEEGIRNAYPLPAGHTSRSEDCSVCSCEQAPFGVVCATDLMRLLILQADFGALGVQVGGGPFRGSYCSTSFNHLIQCPRPEGQPRRWPIDLGD